VCIWGWLGVSFCMLCVALGMAELSSAYPTSGGMYYWQYKLAGRKSGPFACWLTGVLGLTRRLTRAEQTRAQQNHRKRQQKRWTWCAVLWMLRFLQGQQMSDGAVCGWRQLLCKARVT
jgi:amino acid transporter